MSFNWNLATASLLKEGSNQISQITKRQQDLDDRKLIEMAEIRREKATLARAKALRAFEYEEGEKYEKNFWDPARKQMVTNREVASMSEGEKSRLVPLEEHGQQVAESKMRRASSLEAELAGSPEQVAKRGLLAGEALKNKTDMAGADLTVASNRQQLLDQQQADMLGMSLEEYRVKKAENDLYGKKDGGLSGGSKAAAIARLRNDYKDEMALWDDGSEEGGWFASAKPATNKKPSLQEWAMRERPEEYNLIWGDTGTGAMAKGEGGKPSAAAIISQLLNDSDNDNETVAGEEGGEPGNAAKTYREQTLERTRKDADDGGRERAREATKKSIALRKEKKREGRLKDEIGALMKKKRRGEKFTDKERDRYNTLVRYFKGKKNSHIADQ